MNAPLISIVIPVKNGAPWLEQLFPAILRQTLAARTEIIVVDSGSKDETLSIVEKYPVRLLAIDPASFDHGLTRNLGAQQAKGEYVVMTVQDALPTDDRWLEKLLSGFENGTIAGVCGQQVVPHDPAMNPVQWFRPISAAERFTYAFPDPQSFNSLPAGTKKAICSWDNVNAMYRRDILAKVPFRKATFGEDQQWAQDAVLAGYGIAYNYEARVYHYHHENPTYSYKRAFTELYYAYRLFGMKPVAVSRLRPMLRTVKILVREKSIGLKQKFRWLRYNYGLNSAYRRAVREFEVSLARGESSLDSRHTQLCGVAPQAPKPQESI
jgi:rhamnosyltransferase